MNFRSTMYRLTNLMLPPEHCSISGSVDPDVLLQSSSENGFLEYISQNCNVEIK